jgi:hypothetical protein
VGLDAEELERVFQEFFQKTHTTKRGGKPHFCFDGKALRGSASPVRKKKAVRIFEMLNVFSQHILETTPLKSAKNHEIPTLQHLLSTKNLRGCVVTADALHCQKKL